MADDLQGALKEGYSEAEIADFLAKQRGFDAVGARKEGYSDSEIISRLTAPNLPAPTAGTGNAPAPAPLPAPFAGMSQFPEDTAQGAREAAALQMARSVQPPGRRQEGATTRAIEAVYPAVKETATRFEDIAKRAIQSGDIPPGEAIESALLVTGASPAYRTGMGIARSIGLTPEQLAAREVGVTAIPRAASASEGKQAIARGISAAPIVGSPLTSASKKSTEQLLEAGTAAATKPLEIAAERARPQAPARPPGYTPLVVAPSGPRQLAVQRPSQAIPAEAPAIGEATTRDVAGGHIRAGLQRFGDNAPEDLKYLLKKSDEGIIDEMIRLAGSKAGADVKTLVQLRRVVPATKQPEVQSAIIDRLGMGSKGEWDPNTWLRNYGSMPERSRTFLFGKSDTPGGLRYHLDSLEETARRMPDWAQFSQHRATLGTKAGAVALASIGAWLKPELVLGTVVPMNIIARAMARPETVAPLAQWSKAYGNLFRAGGTPAAFATYKVATDNLSKNLGVDLSATDLLRRARESGGLTSKAQEVFDRLVGKAVDWSRSGRQEFVGPDATGLGGE